MLLPYDLVSSIIASSLLCLLPVNPLSNQWLDDVNFTYVFLNILNSQSSEPNKLRCVISYLDYCRSSKLLYSKGLLISRRVWSHLDLLKCISADLTTNHDFESMCYRLMNALSSTHLPCLLVDNTLTSDGMAFKTHLPVVHFMGSRVGGELLSGGISQTAHLFSKYPDLIAVIPLCPRLVDGETLWVDHVRGPFLPQALGLSVKTDYSFEKAVNWSRFILLNGNQYPAWMSEVQYSAQCLVREIILVSSGLFPNELKYNSDLIRPSLFSPLWWDYLASKPDVQSQYVKNRSIEPSNPSIYLRNTEIKWIQTNITSDMLKFVDKFVCGIMCDIQNTIKMMQVNKSSRNTNKPDSLSQQSQNTYDHKSSVQSTLNVVNSLLNISKMDYRLYSNFGRFTTNRPDSGNMTTSNCSPQANCFEHPDVDKTVVYHYADELVGEHLEYGQQLSALHTHHLYTYVDKLISNAFQNANKLMSWSNLLSKQILSEVKYSCVSHDHNNGSNMMKSMNDDMAVEFNRTNSTINVASNRLHEDHHIDEKSPQHQINQQNGSFKCEKKCPTDDLDENQSHQILNKCPSPELCHMFSTQTNNSSLVKDTNEQYMKTHSIKYSNQLISSCINSEKLLSPQPDSIMTDLPHVFISERLFEFSNSIAVQCLISAFGEIYIQRMSYHLNQSPSRNTTPDLIMSNNNQDPSKLNQYNHSNIRPPGLILDCGLEEYSSNYYADPQLRILIQWISATLVYNSPCSKLSYLGSKMNSLSDENKNNDNSDLNKELKNLKDEISMEHSCSPLVCCTNGNSKLKELQTVVSLVYKASWTAKDLFNAILNYFHYRSEHLKLSSNNNNNHGTCFNFRNISIPEEQSKRAILSLFDYLIQQLPHNVSQ
uniref:PARG_cat domain-containing protein n=1 Tax=Schistosoma mansoni TaxID=6183 RepID=A0A5K4FDI9_SCHMA